MALTFTAFGLKKVELKLQGAGTVWTQVLSSEQAMYKQNLQQVKQYGDDVLQNVFNHTLEGQLTVKHNITSMALFSILSGETVGSMTDSSYGTGHSMAFGQDSEMIQPYVSVRAYARTRKSDGTVGLVRVYWYKCMIHTAFDGIGLERAKNSELTYTFEVLSSINDELGNPLACPAFGRFESFDNGLPTC